MDLVEFWTIASANGIVLDENQLKQIKRYQGELLYWNQQVNMISRKDEENILDHHILHSLSVLKYVDLPKKAKCIDVGTGGGLPGIPISIARPDLNILLVDSIKKKVKMTDMFASHTGNKNLAALNSRIEAITDNPKNHRSYDFVFARAVTETVTIIRWVEKLLKPLGRIVLYKGGDLEVEKNTALKNNPGLIIDEISIKLFGYDWFEKEEKKLLICRFDEK